MYLVIEIFKFSGPPFKARLFVKSATCLVLSFALHEFSFSSFSTSHNIYLYERFIAAEIICAYLLITSVSKSAGENVWDIKLLSRISG
jgi:hypothetical protein